MPRERICAKCNNVFIKTRSFDTKLHFCSQECQRTYKSRTFVNCKVCSTLTTNPKFCCSSCAATYNNKMYPKRQRTRRYCKHCHVEIHGRRTVCDNCNPSIVDWNEITYGQLKKLRKYQQNSRVRALARIAYMKSTKVKRCICGYTKHLEVCHITPISSFPDETPVSSINSLDNLIALCPTHHWELDNGILSLDFPDFDYLHP